MTYPVQALIPGLHLGLIVHYIDDDLNEFAAIVTGISEPEFSGYVSLHVFLPPREHAYGGFMDLGHVRHSENADPRTWHFVEQPE